MPNRMPVGRSPNPNCSTTRSPAPSVGAEGTGLGLALVKAVADLHSANLMPIDAELGLGVDPIFRSQ